jgi:hypothetical protein
LRHTGSYSKRQGEDTRHTDPRSPVGQVTAKPANITIRKSKGAELSQEQGMGHEVKGSRKIKIDSISLTLTTDSTGDVKE